jgi:ribonuclease Z
MDQPLRSDSLDAKKIYWVFKIWKIPGTTWEICGYSRAAFRTGFYIKALDLMLDAGPQHHARPRTILITHTHVDHIGELPFTLIGDSNHGSTQPDRLDEAVDTSVAIYGPAEAQKWIEDYIDKLFTTNAMTDPSPREELDQYYKYNGLTPGDNLYIEVKKTRLRIEVFRCDHRIPTISYGFTEVKSKLKPMYRGVNGKEIAGLRAAGNEVMEDVLMKRFAYVCDTTIKVFVDNVNLLLYPVIFIECTFIMPDEVEMASGKKHIHWNDLKPYVIDNPEVEFMLFHFSQRYKDVDIRDFFAAQCDIPNVSVWA